MIGWKEPPLGNFRSHVEFLDINYGNAPIECFSPLLAGFENLRVFSYDVAYESPWDPHAIREALLEHNKDTLETLYISCKDGGQPDIFVGSFQDFPKLRFLVLDYSLFIDIGEPQRLVDMLPISIEDLTLLD